MVAFLFNSQLNFHRIRDLTKLSISSCEILLLAQFDAMELAEPYGLVTSNFYKSMIWGNRTEELIDLNTAILRYLPNCSGTMYARM